MYSKSFLVHVSVCISECTCMIVLLNCHGIVIYTIWVHGVYMGAWCVYGCMVCIWVHGVYMGAWCVYGCMVCRYGFPNFNFSKMSFI